MSTYRVLSCAGLVVLLNSNVVPVAAHDGPEQVIAAVTAAMQRRGPSPELFYRRGCERRVLGELESAESDFAAAVAADPTHFSAGVELARVRLAIGREAAAREAIIAAEPFAESEAEKAICHMVRCQISRSAEKLAAALRECEAACRLLPDEAEWILLRSRLQAELERHTARIRDLTSAQARSFNAAVAIELVEAKIDAGHYAEILHEIEAQLAMSRLKASWLLRRARVLHGLGRDAEARSDLQAAVEELDLRLDPARPDAGLVIERGLAFALLGETALALDDFETTKKLGADGWALRRLERVLSTKPSTDHVPSRDLLSIE
jgi:tetratricopeptide (TPR) repeat protein